MNLTRFAYFFFIIFASLLSGCNPRGHIEAAERAVKVFHQRYNSQQYDAIYDEAGPSFRASASKRDFVAYEANSHEKLGELKSSDIANYNILYLFSGPQVRLDYNAQFLNGHAVESFEVHFKDDKPLIDAYRIDTPLLEEKKR
jgi:hypothetical protein